MYSKLDEILEYLINKKTYASTKELYICDLARELKLELKRERVMIELIAKKIDDQIIKELTNDKMARKTLTR